MKHIVYISLLFILIPFIAITLLFKESKDEGLIIEPDNIIVDEVLVRVKREKNNIIEEIKLEDYIVGVVAGEMPVSFHMEALKAQAVAARSYVLKRKQYNKEKNYDVVDSFISQVYLDIDHLKKSWGKNYENNISKIKTAVLSTKGEYIDYKGTIADTLYFSTSNGYTENSEKVFGFEVPYLRSVESAWDEETSPVFNDLKNYRLADFYNRLDLPFTSIINVNILKISSTGRILELEINNKKLTGTELRSILNLRSADFEIIQQGEEVMIKTTGFGHGVGMSQYGALGMAEQGHSYKEILEYYYKGTTVGKL